MWTTVLIILALILVVVFVSQRWGRSQSERDRTQIENARVKDMLDAETNSPKSKDDLLDQLRKRGL